MAALEAASTVPRALLAACLVLLVLGGGPSSVLRGAEAQGGGGQCLPQLNGLLACRAYLVPGAPDPSADCCSALSAVSHECACSTMGIINSLPGRCNLAQVNCCKLYSEGRNSFISSFISVLSLLIDVFLWFVFMMQPLEP